MADTAFGVGAAQAPGILKSGHDAYNDEYSQRFKQFQDEQQAGSISMDMLKKKMLLPLDIETTGNKMVQGINTLDDKTNEMVEDLRKPPNMNTELQGVKDVWASLDPEDQNSPKGKALKKQIDEMEREAQEFEKEIHLKNSPKPSAELGMKDISRGIASEEPSYMTGDGSQSEMPSPETTKPIADMALDTALQTKALQIAADEHHEAGVPYKMGDLKPRAETVVEQWKKDHPGIHSDYQKEINTKLLDMSMMLGRAGFAAKANAYGQASTSANARIQGVLTEMNALRAARAKVYDTNNPPPKGKTGASEDEKRAKLIYTEAVKAIDAMPKPNTISKKDAREEKVSQDYDSILATGNQAYSDIFFQKYRTDLFGSGIKTAKLAQRVSTLKRSTPGAGDVVGKSPAPQKVITNEKGTFILQPNGKYKRKQ